MGVRLLDGWYYVKQGKMGISLQTLVLPVCGCYDGLWVAVDTQSPVLYLNN